MRKSKRKVPVCLRFLPGSFRVSAKTGRVSRTKDSLAKRTNANSPCLASDQMGRANEDPEDALLATRELANMELAVKGWSVFVLKPADWGDGARAPNCPFA